LNHSDCCTTGDHEITWSQHSPSSRFDLPIYKYLFCIEKPTRFRAGCRKIGEFEELAEPNGLISD
jgi:hypothetical protein